MPADQVPGPHAVAPQAVRLNMAKLLRNVPRLTHMRMSPFPFLVFGILSLSGVRGGAAICSCRPRQGCATRSSYSSNTCAANVTLGPACTVTGNTGPPGRNPGPPQASRFSRAVVLRLVAPLPARRLRPATTQGLAIHPARENKPRTPAPRISRFLSPAPLAAQRCVAIPLCNIRRTTKSINSGSSIIGSDIS